LYLPFTLLLVRYFDCCYKEIAVKTGRTTFRSLILSVFGLSLAATLMAAEPPPPPAIGETFACTYKEGKDFDDKMKARDYMVAQMDKAGLKKVPGYHLTQMKGMAPVDTLWMDVHPSFADFGANSDAWAASGIGAGVEARFDEVEDCTAGLSTLNVIHQQEGGDDGDGTNLAITLACKYLHGKGPQHLDGLVNHMGNVMAGMDADGPGFAYLRTPITGNQDFPDLFFGTVFDDMSHWTRYVGQLFNTDAGAQMRSHMDMVVDCNISLWRSQQVVTPDEE
jgi:hypothetical protein